MTANGAGDQNRRGDALSRRRFVVATGSTATLGVAGCTGEVTQEFESEPVVLPSDARQDLVLAELGRDSRTVTREPGVGDVEGEVTVTSHAAAYHQGPARGHPTLLEGFMSGFNGLQGPGSAKAVMADAVGVESATLDVFDGAPEVPGGQFSFVVPEGVRGDVDELSTDGAGSPKALGLVPGSIVPDGHGSLREEWRSGGAVVPGASFTPSCTWFPEDNYFPGEKWIPHDEWVPNPDALRVFATAGDHSFGEVFGRSVEAAGGRPVEDAESLSAENTLLAVPISALGTAPGGPIPVDSLLEAGVYTPTGAADFGAGVLSTPRAEVAGTAVNPLAREDLPAILQRDEVASMLGRAGLTDAETVEWRGGPEEIERAALDGLTVPGQGNVEGISVPGGQVLEGISVLGEQVDGRVFTGVVDGRRGLWSLCLHVVRVGYEDDVVLVVGGHRTPVAAPSNYPDIPLDVVARSGQFFAAVLERLEASG